MRKVTFALLLILLSTTVLAQEQNCRLGTITLINSTSDLVTRCKEVWILPGSILYQPKLIVESLIETFNEQAKLKHAWLRLEEFQTMLNNNNAIQAEEARLRLQAKMQEINMLVNEKKIEADEQFKLQINQNKTNDDFTNKFNLNNNDLEKLRVILNSNEEVKQLLSQYNTINIKTTNTKTEFSFSIDDTGQIYDVRQGLSDINNMTLSMPYGQLLLIKEGREDGINYLVSGLTALDKMEGRNRYNITKKVEKQEVNGGNENE